MGKKETNKVLNEELVQAAQKKAFVEYNYGDTHAIAPIVKDSVLDCIGKCNEKLGHKIELLDFIRGIIYSAQGLYLSETKSSMKDLTREQIAFMTEYASNSVNDYMKNYIEKFKNIDRPIVMQFPFLAFDSSIFKIKSIDKALAMEKAKSE